MTDKIKTRARARVFSPVRRDDIDGEIRTGGIATTRHHGNDTEPGWGWVTFDRAGFALTFQMRLVQLRRLHEAIGKTIAEIQSVKDCKREDCNACERARREAEAST